MQPIPHMHDFISGLPPEGVAAFEKISTLRKVKAGANLYLKGDTPTDVYRVVSGKVRLCNVTLTGREIVTAEFREGDCFGEMGIIDGLPRVSDAIAVENTTIRVLHKSQFNALLKAYPEINRLLLETLCRRARALYALNEEAQLSLNQRVARAVMRLCFTHGETDEEGSICIRVSQEDLARMLGASRQSVNRELKVLSADGLLSVKYGRIFVTDLDRINEQFENQIGMEQIAPVYGLSVA